LLGLWAYLHLLSGYKVLGPWAEAAKTQLIMGQGQSREPQEELISGIRVSGVCEHVLKVSMATWGTAAARS
jgi:hypothetical protein